jgi:carbamate kinase
MRPLAVLAFGGNALLRSNQKGTYEEQFQNVENTCRQVLPLIRWGYDIVICHGNGPQVGNVMLQQEAGHHAFGLQQMPMDVCGAETQGAIAYMIETAMDRVLYAGGLTRRVISLVTRVEVDAKDPMFKNPTKPVGPYYTAKEAEQLAAETGAVYKEDPKGRGWRKVVPSPAPMHISNVDIVRRLAREGKIVVTCGGGGIPVIWEAGGYRGVEAVIDKDLASALCACQIGADALYILTDVPKVYINFRKPDEKALDVLTIAEAEKYLAQGQFAEGSMAPKIRAAIHFVRKTGGECVITEASQLRNPTCGTRIILK